MDRRFLIAVSVGMAALVVGCDRQSSNPISPASTSESDAAADGSNLKIEAPTLVAPSNGTQMSGGSSQVVLTVSNISGKYASFPVTFEVEVRNPAGTIVANPRFSRASGTTTSFTLTTALSPETTYSWKGRATYSGAFGPWSGTSTFRTGQAAFISGSTVVDPLTTGTTVGRQRGGHFVAGQGWQADTLNDGIDYDITTCANCRLEFDLTNVGNGLGNPADLKWITMGDGRTFSDFLAFREHPWKMHLEQRADGDGTGMKLIFRNGTDGLGNPGDHEGRNDSTVNWQRTQVYRFVLDWTPGGYFLSVNGQVWFSGSFGGVAYAPPSHRISLGCYPRQETWQGAIYRNVTVTPR